MPDMDSSVMVTSWSCIYSQGDPVVYYGDTHFYDTDRGLRGTEE